MAKLFVECIVAPGYDAGALEKFAAEEKPAACWRCRGEAAPEELELKRISGGVLVQEPDRHELSESELKMVTDRAPTDAEIRALLFAWKVSKHVKSNAIVFAREGQTAGIGAGQMSRVDSVKIAVMKAETQAAAGGNAWWRRTHFFRFRTAWKKRANAGATAVIQPGGSVRDADVIAAAEQAGNGDGVYRGAALPALGSRQ